MKEEKDDLATPLVEMLGEHRNALPFLFVGSGFSRRHANLPDWRGLLQEFAAKTRRPLAYYEALADRDMERVGSDIAAAFFEVWWKSDEYSAEKNAVGNTMVNMEFPLKYQVAKRFADAHKELLPQYQQELDALKEVRIAGIVTTNYDSILEHLFPTFETFIGQDEMLLRPLHHIGELYKIHGCHSDFTSLVLTQNDYKTFRKRAKYLTASLLTIFIEHPVVFLGYSLTDRTIQALMKDVLTCLRRSPEALSALERRLIFVMRTAEGRSRGISTHEIELGEGVVLRTTRVVTDDFREVYKALASSERHISVRILRQIKDSIYEIVRQAEPSERLTVVDLEDLDDLDDAEFVVGVGLEVQSNLHSPIHRDELFADLLESPSKFPDDGSLVDKVVSPWLRGGPGRLLIPIHRYYMGDLATEERLRVAARLKLPRSRFVPQGYEGRLTDPGWTNLTLEELEAKFDPERWDFWTRALVAKLSEDDVFAILQKYKAHLEHENQGMRDCWRRLACVYDHMRWSRQENGC